MRTRFATALEKKRAQEMVREWIVDLIVNLSLSIGAGHYWLGAPWWGAWIIFLVMQNGDNARRRAKWSR